MENDHTQFENPNDYTRQFIPPICRPSPMPPKEWMAWCETMEHARSIRDGEVSE